MKTSEHHATGDRVIVMVSADGSLDALFQFEYVCRMVTSAPEDHVHIAREESVKILEGTLHCRASGQERILRAGQNMVVPAGTRHSFWNENPSGCRAIAQQGPYPRARTTLDAHLAGVARPTAEG